ncbi:hypothetical protein B2J88_45305 [Rhodococcus sp. SRB_17]|nr:hypothetical protein [Rhodococcus sp. SRB_17]
MDPIEDDLRVVVARVSGLQTNDLDDEDLLADHLGIASLDLISIYGHFEEEYNIIITDEEAEDVLTLGQMRVLLETKLNDRNDR